MVTVAAGACGALLAFAGVHGLGYPNGVDFWARSLAGTYFAVATGIFSGFAAATWTTRIGRSGAGGSRRGPGPPPPSGPWRAA